MFLWTEDFKLRLGKPCFMCWTPKRGLSVSVTWLPILTKKVELSKHQSIFHQLPISAGQSEQEGSKEQLRTGFIFLTSFLTRSLDDWKRQVIQMQGALHISICLQYPAAACSDEHPVDTLVSLPPDWITATPSTWRGLANSIYCKRHQMVTLYSSSALHQAIRNAGFDL